ncbi:Uncharacterized protein TCAP_04118 [Tolypocladium capitatum]|uniref:Uncharacterized protein n=1 Tax=Tolypocladium capitatum TaxID=45235 RepID=A0A2K3QEI8_9HYPO|nr:Uncharacterized protein TCAP_04118 [Tolypocladium capitatum]
MDGATTTAQNVEAFVVLMTDSALAAAATPTSGEPSGQSTGNPGDDAPPASASTPDTTKPAPGGSSIRDAEEPGGFHQDGRIRNPVPSKLQGITDNSRGNFAVMHIDMAGTKSSERNAAAKRTSEGTEAQARRANQAGWQPVRRSKLAWHGDQPHPQTTRTAPSAAAPAPRTAGPATAAASSRPSSAAPQRQRGPSPQETKAEQARLLTLLRTLHPVLVVDQLCKALAYFGGVPDAPPPPDGQFPNSAAANGPGLLLVAWLSEIYPPVDNPGAIGPPLHLPPLSSLVGRSGWGVAVPLSGPNPYAPGRRARGRPKGSKSSKVRKDKGTKKPRPSPSTAAPSGPPDADRPILVDEHDPGNASPGNAADDAGLQPSSTQAAAPSGAASGSSFNPDSSITATPGARKRGRPKGSKNRPKNYADVPPGTSDPTSSAGPAAPTAGRHTPAIPEGMESGQPAMQASAGTVTGDDAALPAATADAQPPPDTAQTLALPESHLQGSHLQEQDGRPAKASGAKAPSRRKIAKRPAQNDGQAPADGAAAQDDAPAQNIASSPQGPRAKRRRISKESNNQPGAGVDSRALPTNAAASPTLNHPSLSGASPPLPASMSPDSQNSIDKGGSGQSLQQKQRPRQPQPQQPQQRLYTPHSQQQSPNMDGADQQRQHRPVQAAGLPRPRSQVAGAHGGQQQANIPPRALYAQQQQQQQQMASQMGPGGRPGATFGRGATGSHSQYAQHMGRQSSGGSGTAAMPQQRSIATTRERRQQQGHGGARQAHGYANQQRAHGATQPSSMNSFHDYGEQSYLNMDYGLTERDVQDAAAVTAFGSPTQLPGGHMYQGIGPR